MQEKLILFDLDGTLVDTSQGIMECIQYAAEKLGYPELNEKQLRDFIGPPLKDSFMRCYGCDEEEAKRLMTMYRMHYREGALFHAKPYDGIIDLCKQLKNDGMTIGVATSKPQEFAEQILHRFGFDPYLDMIHGADMEGRLKKSDLIRLCMKDAGSQGGIMIGDTEHDAKGAQEAGAQFVAVTYGFGNREEMLSYPRIGVAKTTLEILEIIRSALGSEK